MNIRPLLLSLTAVLGGCDNASVNVTDSGWKTIATNTAQLPPNEKFSTTLIAQGTGAIVNAGDLVKMRINDGTHKVDGTELLRDAWYWTGYLPSDLYHYGAIAPTIFGGALVGHRVGDAFLFEPEDKNQYPIYVRLSGMAEPDQNRKGLGHMEFFNDSSVAWDNFTLRRSKIEIVASCPVKLSIRHGQMTQWGYILNMFGTGYQTDRRGSLFWSAIDATCPQPDNEVRFMIGPIHFTPLFDGNPVRHQVDEIDNLYNWQDAYRAARPKAKYPVEYQHVVVGDKWIHREIQNQNWVDAASPVPHTTVPTSSTSNAQSSSSETRESRNAKIEGSIWATDNGIDSAVECKAGSPAFIEGCKSAVARRAARTGK